MIALFALGAGAELDGLGGTPLEAGETLFAFLLPLGARGSDLDVVGGADGGTGATLGAALIGREASIHEGDAV